jgi:hypothetical protein
LGSSTLSLIGLDTGSYIILFSNIIFLILGAKGKTSNVFVHKILGTKASAKSRASRVLARSTDTRECIHQVLGEDLDCRARRKLREQESRVLEKDYMRDVLVATNIDFSSVKPVMGQVVSNMDGGRRTRCWPRSKAAQGRTDGCGCLPPDV